MRFVCFFLRCCCILHFAKQASKHSQFFARREADQQGVPRNDECVISPTRQWDFRRVASRGEILFLYYSTIINSPCRFIERRDDADKQYDDIALKE